MRVGSARFRDVLCSTARFFRGVFGAVGAGRFGLTNDGGSAWRCSNSAIRTNAVCN